MQIDEYLRNCRDLNRLCTQNGWIDNDSLRVDVLDWGQNSVLASVNFQEIVMEASGCMADRVACYGRIRLHLDVAGAVTGMDILHGSME